MGCCKNNCLSVILVVSVLFVSCVEQTLAIRPLEGDKWVETNLKIQSLARGKVPSSGSSSCTYVPGGSGRCPLNEMNVAGHVARATVNFGIASTTEETQKRDSSS
ncbi:conserved hypothetical protein [Ricinus communis]|uniref:Uncharacterized protein n=1 Tax=Ricinus communis TaxID=3988 RepID=B9S7I0_RICCO|nr:conserved hypothetical protein [Ricinus communis]